MVDSFESTFHQVEGARCAFEDCKEALKEKEPLFKRKCLKDKDENGTKRSSEEKSGIKLSKTDDEDKAKVAEPENEENGKGITWKRSERQKIYEVAGRLNKPGSEEREEKPTKVQSKESEKPDKIGSQEKARKHTKLSSREKDEKVSRLDSGREPVLNKSGSRDKLGKYMKSVNCDDKDSD
ncbi:hypothetical protein COOONC_07305 [Cooperia oncophora]